MTRIDRLEYYKRYNKENRQKRNEWFRLNRKPNAKRRYYERRNAVVQSYKARPCMDCNVMYPHYVMQFDHRPGEHKVSDVCQLLNQSRPLKIVIDEIAKCDVVCANCHSARTHLRREEKRRGEISGD